MRPASPSTEGESAGAGAASDVQVPGSTPSQLSSSPLQAVSQQTPSAQNPEAQSDGVVHAAPLGIGVWVAVAVDVAVAVRVGVGVQGGCDTPPQVLQTWPLHCAGAMQKFPGQQN